LALETPLSATQKRKETCVDRTNSFDTKGKVKTEVNVSRSSRKKRAAQAFAQSLFGEEEERICNLCKKIVQHLEEPRKE